MIEPTSFLYAHDAATGVATITLNRPDRLNALTFEVYGELERAFRALDDEPGVRAIVITGQGRAFCSGGDVEDIIGPLLQRDATGLLEFTTMTCDLIAAIRACRRPVIAALNGTTAGAGAVIAAACDIRIAAESAKVAFLFTKVGLSGADMGAAWLLPRIVGLGRATEILMTGEFVDAAEAWRIGLYNRVVPDGEALPAALELASRLARGPSAALAVTKRALEDEAGLGLAEALAAEARAQAACMESANFREAYEAFVAKRPRAVRVGMHDVDTIRAFLDEPHVRFAEDVDAFARAGLRPRPEPADDAAARVEARAILKLLGDGGWLAPISARDLRRIALAREAIAAASPLADAVYALQALGATPILLAGDRAAARDRWVDEAVAGRAMGAFAMTEADAGSDVASMTTTARKEAGGWILDGAKSFISNAGIADFYTVFAQTEPGKGSKGIACFVVPADAPGLAFAGAQVLSAPHPLGEIRFEGCRIPKEACLAGPGEGFKLGLATLDLLRATVGAAACGMAGRALEEALTHALERRQFGEALAEFQLVQEKLARMATELAAARLLVYRAAWAKDRGAERVTLESAMAKAHATEVAQKVIDDAVQILGGRGVLADHPVDRLYRSVRALRIYEGTTEIQRLVIAGQLLARAREASP